MRGEVAQERRATAQRAGRLVLEGAVQGAGARRQVKGVLRNIARQAAAVKLGALVQGRAKRQVVKEKKLQKERSKGVQQRHEMQATWGAQGTDMGTQGTDMGTQSTDMGTQSTDMGAEPE